VQILGKLSIESYVERTVVPDLLLIGSIILGIILAFELAVTRSLLPGIILWLMTLLPAVWTLGLFPPLGLALGVETMLVPLIVLALSTSYGIQFFRYLALGTGSGIGPALNVTTPVIFGAGLTTILGFLSLLGSPFSELRVLGGMLVCGIAFAMAAAFFLLPVLFSRVIVPRFKPFGGSDALADFSDYGRIPLFFIAVMIALLAGFIFIRNDYRLEKALSGRTDISRTIEYFYRKYGGVNEVEILVDTGREAGLVDPEVFQAVKSIRRDLETEETVSHVLTYTELVDWVNGRLSGDESSPSPRTEAAIGESLELLGYGDSGWGIGSLVDGGFRRARIIARFGRYEGSAREAGRVLSSLLARIDSSLMSRLPSARWTVTGEPVMSQRIVRYLVGGQLSGAGIYFLLLFVYAMISFKSWRWALLAMLPPLCGLIFFLGVMGWAQVPLSHVTVMAIAAIMGVGVDDVLCLLIYYRNSRGSGESGTALQETFRISGSAIVQTTSIIVLSLMALLFSRYAAFIQIALLAGSSFIFCASVTLFVVPHFIRRFGGLLP
jgi:predicted RND superfamily exporter protein